MSESKNRDEWKPWRSEAAWAGRDEDMRVKMKGKNWEEDEEDGEDDGGKTRTMRRTTTGWWR